MILAKLSMLVLMWQGRFGVANVQLFADRSERMAKFWMNQGQKTLYLKAFDPSG